MTDYPRHLLLVDKRADLLVGLVKLFPNSYIQQVRSLHEAGQLLKVQRVNAIILGVGVSSESSLTRFFAKVQAIKPAPLIFHPSPQKPATRITHIRHYPSTAQPEDIAARVHLALEEQSRKNERAILSALVKTSWRLNKEKGTEKQLQVVWHFVREQLSAATFFVALYDPKTNHLNFPIAYDNDKAITISPRSLEDEHANWGLSGFVTKTGKELSWDTSDQGHAVCASLDAAPIQIGDPCQSCLYIPIRQGDTVLGTISIQSYNSYDFPPFVRDIVRALANQLAVALENSYLLDQATQTVESEMLRANALEILQILEANLNSSLKVSQIIKNTCKIAVKFFKADHSGLVLFSDDYASGQVWGEHPDWGARNAVIPVSGIPLEEQLIATKKPIAIADIEHAAGLQDLGKIRDMLRKINVSSIVFVPVISNGRVIGSFSLDSVKQRVFTKKEIHLCEILAAHVTVAIENARLYEQLALRNKQLEKISRATTHLFRRTEKSSPNNLLRYIARQVVELLDAEVCSVLLVKQKGFLSLEAEYGYLVGKFERGRRFAIQSGPRTGLTGHIAYAGKLFNTYGEGLINHPAVTGLPPEHLSSQHCFSLLAIPLFGEEKHELIGLLRAENKKKNGIPSAEAFFSDEDEWILKIFAEAVVVAIENRKLMDQITRSRRAALAIAQASALGDLDVTLDHIVRGARKALGCDIATLYTYDDARHHFVDYKGVGCEIAHMTRPGQVGETSVLWKIIELDELCYKTQDACQDKLLSGYFVQQEGIRSALAIKLVFGEHVVGILFINYRQVHDFNAAEVEDAQQFAYQAAISIRNAQLYLETKKFADRLNTLRTAITSAKPLQETLGLIAEQAANLTNVTGTVSGSAQLALVENQQLHFKAGYPANQLPGLKRGIGVIDLTHDKRIGISGRAVKQGHSIIVDDVTSDPDFIPFNKQTHSEISVPILDEGNVIGVINVEHPERNFFDIFDQVALEQLAAQVAITIRTARHYEALKHHAELREGLLKIGQAIISLQEPEKILHTLVWKVREILNADVVTLFTYNQKGDQVNQQVAVAGNLRDRNLAKRLANVQEYSIVRQILANREPRFADNTIMDEMFGAGDFALREKIISSAGIPLLIGDEPVGVIFVNYRHPHNFEIQEQEDLKLFATQTAIAIQNSRRFEELKLQKGLVGSRTALVWMNMASGVWGHSLVGHAVNIRNAATMMRRDMDSLHINEAEAARFARRLEIIESQAGKILDKEMPPGFDLENAELLTLNDLLTQRVNSISENHPNSNIRIQLKLDGNPVIRMTRDWFRYAIDILIENAFESMENLSHGRITIRTAITSGRVLITVSDTGNGIPPEQLDKILKDPINPKKSQKGFGMGLLLVQVIVQAYEGDIALKKTGPKGTTFVLTLPVA